jgi:hypothetical protein
VIEVPLASINNSNYSWNFYTLVGDPVDPTGFYLGLRENVGKSVGRDSYVFDQYKYYAQRWNKSGNSFVAAEKINIPGQLMRTWGTSASLRYFMTEDYPFTYVPPVDTGTYGYYRNDTRLNLLHQVSVGGNPAAELLDSRVFSNIYLAGLTFDANTMYAAGNQNYYGYYYPTKGVSVGGGGASTSTPSWETTSDRLMIFDLTNNRFDALYDQPTKAYNLAIMGAKQGRLFLNLSGDGILAVDVSDPTQPTGAKFLRTLGWASYLEAVGDDLYVASGYFGLDHMSLSGPNAMAIE